MPVRRLLASLTLVLPLATCLGGEAAAATRAWSAPVAGPIVAPFAYDARVPYAARARRGIDLAARPGAAVRAACAGRVTHAGAVPGRWRRGVTVRCGHLAATHLGLAAVAVRRGASVRRGARLGTAARDRIRLGARRGGERHGYVDPAALLIARVGPPAPAPLPPAPAARRPPVEPPSPPGPAPPPRLAPVPPHPPVVASPSRLPVSPHPAPAARRPASVPPSRPVPAPHVTPAAGGPPSVAWAGLVLAALGLPAGGVVAGRRRRRSLGALARRALPSR